jgi:VIT1/CCC1 family predicted Fe2+/Mn2+ transporter
MPSLLKFYLKEFVYGGMDGAVTTFSVIAGSIGANLGLKSILILGAANLLADGFSMSVGDYLSETSTKKDNRELDAKAKKDALSTYFSFLAVGSIPLVPFILGNFITMNRDLIFTLSIGCAVFSFILIGLMRSSVLKISKLKSVAQTLGLGSIASAFAYFAGIILEKILTK